MTGYTVQTGSNEKFREGWDRIFQSKSTARKKVQTGKDAGTAKKQQKKK